MANVLVTGASKGIGLATALAFARAGHRVVAGMRNPAQAPELAGIAAREGLEVSIETLDVDSDGSVSSAIEDVSMDDVRAVMETNYFGAVRCIKAVIPAMRERRSGCIVNVTSMQAWSCGRVTRKIPLANIRRGGSSPVATRVKTG
jgi:NAD(P)-dependent dehydrogenase (short-subunit alcohol dehydrogenase family)